MGIKFEFVKPANRREEGLIWDPILPFRKAKKNHGKPQSRYSGSGRTFQAKPSQIQSRRGTHTTSTFRPSAPLNSINHFCKWRKPIYLCRQSANLWKNSSTLQVFFTFYTTYITNRCSISPTVIAHNRHLKNSGLS